MDPVTLGLLAGGLGGLGNFLGGQQQVGASNADRAERIRQFNAMLQQQKQGSAMSIQGRLDTAPLRDRLLYNMTQRAGMPSRTFKPMDMFNPVQGQTAPQYGGIDQDALGAKMNQYTPGAGGVNTDILKKIQGQMGYGPQAQPQQNNAQGMFDGLDPKAQELLRKWNPNLGQQIQRAG